MMYDEESKYVRTEGGVAVHHKETYVAFVLDESGSMNSCVHEAITGFNEQLNVIKEQGHHGGVNFVSLYKFGCRPDSKPRRVFKNKRPSMLKKLTRQNYSPFGGTPMRDGVGMALSDLMQYDKDDGVNRAFLVMVFTDGYENASVEWSIEQLNEHTEQLQERGNWTISYIGNKVDPNSFDETLFVYTGNIAYATNMYDASQIASESLSAYYVGTRSAGMTQTSTFVEDGKTSGNTDS
jgi:hypothetical protein